MSFDAHLAYIIRTTMSLELIKLILRLEKIYVDYELHNMKKINLN